MRRTRRRIWPPAAPTASGHFHIRRDDIRLRRIRREAGRLHRLDHRLMRERRVLQHLPRLTVADAHLRIEYERLPRMRAGARPRHEDGDEARPRHGKTTECAVRRQKRSAGNAVLHHERPPEESDTIAMTACRKKDFTLPQWEGSDSLPSTAQK